MNKSGLAWLAVGGLASALVAGAPACGSSRGTPPSLDAGPAADAPTPPPPPPPPPPGTHLRIVTGNLTSGNSQAYEAPGIRIFHGVAPDIAMVQEFNVANNAPADLRSFVDQAFGTEFSFVRGAMVSGGIPNGIVTRYPIVASGEWIDTEVANRDFVWARIDIPGPTDLYAISVHLLTRDETVRNVEAGELVQNIGGLPAGVYVALGGDFNTDTRAEAGVQTLSAVLVTGGSPPVDQANLSTTNSPRSKPYDWVLANSALEALATGATIGGHVFDHGLVVDTRVYAPIADLAPALAADSAAVNMQHMAVVRDFTLPDAPPASVRVTAPNGGEPWLAGTTQDVTWSATGVTSVSVELSTDGTTWTSLAASTPAAAGQLTVTVPAIATTSALVRVSAVPGGSPSDVSDAPFTIRVAPPPTAGVFLHQVLANEVGSATAGELVELVNSPDGDPAGAFVLHDTLVASPSSPGTRADGTAF